MAPDELTGQCSCGTVKYKASGRIEGGYCCHCTDCQTRTGSAFASLLPVSATGLEVAGETRRLVQPEGEGIRAVAHVCPKCLTRLFNINPVWPDLAILRAGTLDRGSDFVPALHIWTCSAQPWIRFPADAVVLAEQPASPDEWQTLLFGKEEKA